MIQETITHGFKEHITKFVPEIDSPEKVYELFRGLMYPKDKVLDSTYKRKIQEFDFAKEEKEKVKDIYTIFNYDGRLQIFLIETKTLSIPLVRYLTKCWTLCEKVVFETS